MLIEFNGLPGCGKSTVARHFMESIGKHGIDYLFLQTQIDYYSHNRAKLLLMLLKYFASKELMVLKLYLRLVHGLKNTSFRVAFNSWRNYCICLEILKKTNKEIIIADQFIIQSVLSCFHNTTVDGFDNIQQLIDIVERKISCCVYVDVTSSPSISAERIKFRNTHGGRLDDLDDSNLSALLHLQADNIAAIRSSTRRNHVITINSSDSPEMNSAIIFEHIEGIDT